jgi:hypothetical protein
MAKLRIVTFTEVSGECSGGFGDGCCHEEFEGVAFQGILLSPSFKRACLIKLASKE